MKFWLAIHHPEDYDPSLSEDDAMSLGIDRLNEDMVAAGVRLFAGGLHPGANARSLRAQPDGTVQVAEGPYLSTREHVGGFWILEVADLDAALIWGGKAAVACRAPVEVRQFY